METPFDGPVRELGGHYYREGPPDKQFRVQRLMMRWYVLEGSRGTRSSWGSAPSLAPSLPETSTCCPAVEETAC